MELNCPHCGAPIPASDINIQALLAVCGRCDQVFSINREAFARKQKRRPLVTPPRLRVIETTDRLELSFRLVFGPGAVFGLVMASIGALVLSLVMGLAGSEGAPLPVLLIMGIMAAVLAYTVAAFLTTTTCITVDASGLEITSGPLPFPATDDKTLSLHEVKRVFYEQSVEAWPPGMPAHVVRAELTDGSTITLLSSLPYAHARYIAATLNGFLHADDEPAPVLEYGSGDADAAQDDLADDELVAASDDGPASRHARSG